MVVRFSVVIPCYNEADYIADTIKSLRAQTFRGGYEIVVVDNNCTDDTVEIARRLEFSLKHLDYQYPDDVIGGADPQEAITRLAWEGAAQRYPNGATWMRTIATATRYSQRVAMTRIGSRSIYAK